MESFPQTRLTTVQWLRPWWLQVEALGSRGDQSVPSLAQGSSWGAGQGLLVLPLAPALWALLTAPVLGLRWPGT